MRLYRKRPCRVCRRWYRPDPRQGENQKTCGRDECKREWNRRLCAKRRLRERDADREGRLRDRLQNVDISGLGAEPDRALNQKAVRHSIGLEVFVVIDEYARVTREWMRHSTPLQLTVNKGKSDRLMRFGPRHSIDHKGCQT